MPTYRTVSLSGLEASLQQAAGKSAKNASGTSIDQFSVCAWTNTGTLVLAEADTITADSVAGVAADDIANNAFGLVRNSGKLEGAVASLTPVPGQLVYLSETPGLMTLDISGFAPDATIVKLGVAEPADGVTGIATDLRIDIEVVQGSGGLFRKGSPAAPEIIVPATGIVPIAVQRQVWYVVSQGGVQAVTASPQIAAGTIIDAELTLTGTSDTNYPTLDDTSTVIMNGPVSLKSRRSITYVWTGLAWKEISRT